MSYSTVLVLMFLLIILVIIVRILIDPIKIFLKLLFSCIISLTGIFIFNLVGGIVGFHIGMNFITVISIGVLGFPGVALILILQTLFPA